MSAAIKRRTALVLTGLLSASFLGAIAQAQSTQGQSAPTQSTPTLPAGKPAQDKSKPAQPAKAANKNTKPGTPSQYLPNRFAGRAGLYYKAVWGVDSLSVKTVESGEIIRFAWRVLDPDRAKPLNDKKAEPSLVDPKAGVQLVVPTMEQIGQLRQTAPPEAGKSYWMAFSNKGRYVKRGDRVNVVIGQFRADGLMVD
jgi:hypothetical protein